MFQDVRLGLRILAKNPGSTTIAILALALAIGVNTAIFSVLNAALLKFLPVHNPAELVTLTDPNASMLLGGLLTGDRSLLTYTEFVELRDRSTSLSGLCASQMALQRWPVRISHSAPEQVQGRLVSENYFTVFGVEPARGRFFTQHDAAGIGQDPYAVISYDYWQRRFGGNPSVLGTPIHLHQTTLTIIGIAPQGFHGETVGQNPDLWLPILMQPLVMPGGDALSEYFQAHDKFMWLHAFGRRKPGVSLAQVQAETNVLFRGILAADYPKTMEAQERRRALNQHIVVRPLRAGMFHGRAEFSAQWAMLSALAGLILLMSCANVANLLLARATARAREVAIRISLGAARRRLFRQFLTESLLLAALSGAAGILLAAAALRALLQLLASAGNSLQLAATIDWRVLAFTACATLITGLLFGLAPAFRSTSVPRPTRSKLSKALVIAQVSLSFLLVLGAGLFLQTLWNLQSVPLGFRHENLLLVHIDENPNANLAPALAERMRKVPGVRAVTYSNRALFGFDGAFPISVEGFTPHNQDEGGSTGGFVGPGYFSTLGIPLLLGREIGPRDTAQSRPVCVINESFAKHFFAGRNPLGQHITTTGHSMEVIGVAADARTHSLRGKIDEKFYAAAGQNTGASWFEVRTAIYPNRLAQTLRREIPSIDSAQSAEELIHIQNAEPRFIAELCAAFGILALVLASSGIYGLLSYTVAQRTKEFGIRIALGAGKRRVAAMVLRETATMLAIGALTGLAIAVAMSRVAAAQLYGAAATGPRWSLARYEHVDSATRLYGLRATDPFTIAAVLSILCIAALLAAYFPAARASRVDPARTLRHDLN